MRYPRVLLVILATFCIGVLIVSMVSADENVALAGKGAIAVSDSDYGAQSASLAIDGKWIGPGDPSDANRWHAALGKPHPHWVWIRFSRPARISRVVIHRAGLEDYPVDFSAGYSPDGGFTLKPLFSVTGSSMSADQFTVERSFTPVVTDNLRLMILRSSNTANPSFAQLSEVEVFGAFTGSATAPKPAPAPAQFSKSELKPSKADGLKITERGDEVEFRSPWLRLVFSRTSPRITALCWDSLGKGKVDENLLKPGSGGGASAVVTPIFPTSAEPSLARAEIDGNVVRYALRLPGGVAARWEIRVDSRAVRMLLSTAAPRKIRAKHPAALEFVFDVSKTPVAPIANPGPQSNAPLPCILHATDYGSLLVESVGRKALALEGRPIRSQAQWNASICGNSRPGSDGLYTLAAGLSRLDAKFSVRSVTPIPSLAAKDSRLGSMPRHWLNTFQYKPDIGILANNIVSDNCVFCMHQYADAAVFTPTLPGGIEAIQTCRQSLDRYFAGAPGYGVGWEHIMIDCYPSLLIAAWDVIRATGDLKRLRAWQPRLEAIAELIEKQDRNGNGLPESVKPGTKGKIHCPTSNWWDQVNFGHEDAYACALAYRGWRCLADLEGLLGNTRKAARYQENARRVKAAYVPSFLNPDTGILAGWRDSNGNLHDYWFVFVNGIAITYGLVPDEQANKIVDRIESKMREVGYNRFELGLPGNLVPVPKNDYGIGALGSPKNDDGNDAFGVFENGGASACMAYHYIQALYKLGRRAEADRILNAMMKTYASGGYQNGVGKGGEWTRWDGKPSGYEGMLADAYYAQLALFTGHYGITFTPTGFHLDSNSPLKGKHILLGLKYMGKTIDALE